MHNLAGIYLVSTSAKHTSHLAWKPLILPIPLYVELEKPMDFMLSAMYVSMRLYMSICMWVCVCFVPYFNLFHKYPYLRKEIE